MDPDRIAEGIPATFVMISGSEDKQTSADVFNVGTFDLPHTAGKAGGACTSTLLKVINENPGPMSWLELLQRMRDVLTEKGFDQVGGWSVRDEAIWSPECFNEQDWVFSVAWMADACY